MSTALRTLDMVEPGFPRIPVGEWVDDAFDWIEDNLGGFFSGLGDAVAAIVGGSRGDHGLTELLQTPPTWAMIAFFALIAWLVRDWKLALTSAVALAAVVGMDQWDNAMKTLAMVLFATIAALLIAVPLGIAAARWDVVSRVVRPAMDLMQTMPAFVWLVPVVSLFGLNVSAGLMATVIFALPPGVRLTELGIRQVDAEVVEAGQAFGGTPRQILGGIQVPLAMPTIMAGINQVIMLALSMAVIAGMVAAGGLGGEVTTAINRLNIGLGFEAGLSVVVLAIYLDRVTASVGSGGGLARRLKSWLTNRSTRQSSEEAGTEPASAVAPATSG